MNNQVKQQQFNPIQETFRDITPFQLLLSSLRIFCRIYRQKGLTSALKVIPIIWTVIVAIKGFSRWHINEFQRLQGTGQKGGDLEETIIQGSEYEQYRRLGKWLREKLYQFGPTFIKIGQTLSTRADLLPLPAMMELAALQEDVKPFPFAIARQTIIKGLGAPPEDLYVQFNPKPIAAASLSQAYKAQLTDGRDVVVKVQRPNLPMIIASDVQILEAIADEVMRYPSLCRHTNWPGVVEEFARTTFAEIDYIQEGRNADRFRHNFRGNTRIHIPRIIWRLTGRRVLTIEYVAGVKVTDVETMKTMGINRREVTKSGALFYLRQLLEDGFFHADPHPGNIRIMADGKVGLFDFGMVGIVSTDLKRNLVSAFLHVMERQYDYLIDDFIAMGFLTDDVDKLSLTKELSPIIEARFAQGINRVQFRKILFDFSEIVWRYPFKLPSEFTYIMRALLTLEGVALTIDPEFNFVDSALPFAQRLLLKSSGQVFRQALLRRIFAEGRFNPNAAINLFKTASRLTVSDNAISNQ